MAFTFANELISDLHKDAYGFRPSQRFFDDWKSYSDEEKQEVWDALIHTMEYNQKEEARHEADNLNKFRETVRKVMNTCGVAWNDAIDYLWDAEDDTTDFDYFLWNYGIGYNDRRNIRKLYEEAAQ